jgi:hypothetical protein
MRQPLPFVAFDDRLSEAARQEGLTIASVLKGRRIAAQTAAASALNIARA